VDYYSNQCDEISEIEQGAYDIAQTAELFGLDFSRNVKELEQRIEKMPDPDSALSGPRYRPYLERRSLASQRIQVRELFAGLAE
jgi:hypothetical protein